MVISREYRYASFSTEKGAASVFPAKDHKYQKILEDEKFILYLGYLSDIFGVMNHFNRYLPRAESSIIGFATKLSAFILKLDL